MTLKPAYSFKKTMTLLCSSQFAFN